MKMSLKGALLVVFGMTFFTTCTISPEHENTNQYSLPFIPVFQNMEDADRGSRSILVSELDAYGLMMFPRLSYFTANPDADNENSVITVKIFNDTYEGVPLYNPNNDTIEVTFDLGPTSGLINIIYKPGNVFDYRQIMIMDMGAGDRNLYAVYELKDVAIEPSEDLQSGEFIAQGRVYYGWIVESEEEIPVASIWQYDMGTATTYIRGTQHVVYGIVDPRTVNEGDYPLPEQLSIGRKSYEEVTVSDIIEKLGLITSASYSRTNNDNYPMNDLYYLLDREEMLSDLSDSYATNPTSPCSSEEFTLATDLTFSGLGFPDSENIFEFIGESLGLDYWLIGASEDSIWENSEIDGVTYNYHAFTVEASGVYGTAYYKKYIVMDSDFNPIESTYKYLEIGKTYYLAYAAPLDPVGEPLPDNTYIFKLE